MCQLCMDKSKMRRRQELNRNCESSKCTFLAFMVVVESGSLSSDMLIVGRNVAGLDGSDLMSNDGASPLGCPSSAEEWFGKV